MNELIHWFGMHGYSIYIWPAYGLVLGVLCVNALIVKWQGRRIRKELLLWFKRPCK